MKETRKRFYTCEICGNEYQKKSDAVACESRGIPKMLPVDTLFQYEHSPQTISKVDKFKIVGHRIEATISTVHYTLDELTISSGITCDEIYHDINSFKAVNLESPLFWMTLFVALFKSESEAILENFINSKSYEIADVVSPLEKQYKIWDGYDTYDWFDGFCHGYRQSKSDNFKMLASWGALQCSVQENWFSHIYNQNLHAKIQAIEPVSMFMPNFGLGLQRYGAYDAAKQKPVQYSKHSVAEISKNLNRNSYIFFLVMKYFSKQVWSRLS